MKIFLFLIILASSLSSCSLVGLGIGALIDGKNSHDVVPIFPDIDDYKGQAATIRYHDSIAYVTFTGYSDEPEDQYRSSYEGYLRSHPSSSATLPLGDTVTTRSLSFTGAFGGYFPEGILLSNKRYYLGKFDDIISPKHLSKADLKMLFESNAIPIKAILHFRERGNEFSLTNRDFENVMITYESNGNAKWIGFGIGAAFDIGYIIFIAFAASHSQGSFANAPPIGAAH